MPNNISLSRSGLYCNASTTQRCLFSSTSLLHFLPLSRSFEEIEAQITAQMKTPVLGSRPGPEGSRPGLEGSTGEKEKTRKRESQSLSRTQSTDIEHGAVSRTALNCLAVNLPHQSKTKSRRNCIIAFTVCFSSSFICM